MAKTVIVGGGVSGLSAGIYTLLNGGEALICESHIRCGGNLTGWDRRGYRIDNCIHWLTGTNPVSPLYKVWCELGALGGVGIKRAESLYTYEQDGERVSLYYDIERTEAELLSLSHEDRVEIKRLFSAVRGLSGMQGMGGPRRDGELSGYEKFKTASELLRYHGMSTGRLAAHFRSPLIKGFISGFIGEDFSALALIAVFSAFTSGNGGVPEGGSVAMAERMQSRFLSLGGELRLGRAVTAVNTEGGRATGVTLSDGSVIPCDYLILTPEPASVFGKILHAPMPRAISALYKSRRAYRFSSIHAAFSADASDLGFRGDLIMRIPEKYRSVLGSGNIIIREFSSEPSFSPEGKQLLQTMIFTDGQTSEFFVSLKKSIGEYRERKKLLAAFMGRIVAERFPSVADSLTCLDAWTPATYKRYTGADIGSYMSFIMPPRMIPPRVKFKMSGFSNIYLATQWATLPGGLPNAALQGKKCAAAIAEAHKAHIKEFDRLERGERGLV